MIQMEKIRSKTAGRTLEEVSPVKRKNAVLIPLVETGGELSILFEVRQTGIRQGGEICFPGGGIEENETAEEAAVREASEELLKKLRIFEIPEVRERYNSLTTSTTVSGTLAVRFLKK